MATKKTDASKGTDDELIMSDEPVSKTEGDKTDSGPKAKVPADGVTAIGSATAPAVEDDRFADTGGLIFSHKTEAETPEPENPEDREG